MSKHTSPQSTCPHCRMAGLSPQQYRLHLSFHVQSNTAAVAMPSGPDAFGTPPLPVQYVGMPNFNMDMFLAQIASKPTSSSVQVSPTGQAQAPLIAAPHSSPPQQLLDTLVGFPHQSVMYMPVPYGAPGQPYYPPPPHQVYAYGNVPFPPAVYQPTIVRLFPLVSPPLVLM